MYVFCVIKLHSCDGFYANGVAEFHGSGNKGNVGLPKNDRFLKRYLNINIMGKF